MRYCKSCVLPETRPNLVIGPDGECNACKSHRAKREIDWQARERFFRQFVDRAKAKSQGYDVLIPVSGGKDSTWQTVKCLEYCLRPLTFTYAPPLRTELGRINLENLIDLGVDHIDYRISPRVEKVFLRRALERYGNVGTPMHMAIFSIARMLGQRFRIPMIVWGEDSSVEYGGQKDEGEPFELNDAWLQKFGVKYGTDVGDWIDDELTAKAMTAYAGATDAELEQSDTISVFLGYFFSWDPETSKKVAMDNGMRINEGSARMGLWNYADLDDALISVHHYLKWFKFGFTRLFDNVSVEIRNGRMTREQGIDVIRKTGDQTPHEDIDAFCRFTAMSRAQFDAAAERFRDLRIWTKTASGWRIPSFLIADWSWR